MSRGLRFELGRVTIELLTPLGIGGGDQQDTADLACVLDGNGLPALPGTALAGLLRHDLAGPGELHERPDGPDAQAFGWQREDDGEASRVEISWGQVHDGSGRPVPAFVPEGLVDDDVLTLLRRGVVRDHVRLSHRGVVDGRGKFDQRLVPAGARFTFELRVHPGAGVTLPDLVARLRRPDLRLGGRTRAGLGAFTVVGSWGRAFDLAQAGDRHALLKLPRELADGDPQRVLPALPAQVSAAPAVRAYALALQPVDLWAFGGGDPVLHQEHFRREGEAMRRRDLLPLTEEVIAWTGGRGTVERRHVLRASGLKGALRHRFAFHARRLAGAVVPVDALDDPANEGAIVDPRGCVDPAAEARAAQLEVELFGDAKEGLARTQEGADEAPGRHAGRLYLDDLYVSDVVYSATQHVSLDRFTQGPVDGRLFDAAPLFGGSHGWRVIVDVRRLDPALRGQVRAAWQATLDDLCRGALPIGAASGRGFGAMRGAWTDQPGPWPGEGA